MSFFTKEELMCSSPPKEDARHIATMINLNILLTFGKKLFNFTSGEKDVR
jgi:hypothetical protein